MNKLIRSLFVKIAAFIAGYAAALSAARSVSRGIYNRSWAILRDSLYGAHTGLYVCLFLMSAGLFYISIWQSKDKDMPRPWRAIDLSLFAFLTACAVYLCTFYAWRGPNAYTFLLLSAVCYTVVMLFAGDVLARIRDNMLPQSLVWPRFFKLYTPTGTLGFLMLALLVKDLLILFAVAAIAARYGLNLPLFLASVLSVCVSTYICFFILSLSAEYETANAEKIRSERFKSELITNVSHDIRTPLTSIINYVDLLKTLNIQNEHFKDYVKVLDKKAARLKTLINDLMDASKAATGNVPVDLRGIDLTEIVGQIAGEFDEVFMERGLTLVFRQPDEKVLVKADSSHLWRVLENLFGNAGKYALPGTRVFAEIGRNSGGTYFSLKNTSQNPIEINGASLAEQFIRGDRSRHTEGSGLGLYIAKSLTELMGGKLEIRVNGDLFEVELKLLHFCPHK